MSQKATILLVEDNEANALLYKTYLDQKCQVICVSDGKSALKAYNEKDIDLIVLDVQLPDINGLTLLKTLRQQDEKTPIIIITAHGSVDIALDAMKFGANDFLSKPFDKARLIVTLDNQLKGHQLSKIISSYERSCNRSSYERMIGSSLAMQSVYNIIESAASSKATVFITGESGTGKELCAEAIHNASPRKDNNFVALNCAAIPHDLLESEIFGHVKGAFTGASQNREGAAVSAHNGTLFLDEIGEMPMSLQSKLLRFIQTGCFQPVGSNKEVKKDIRFVCATNRDPMEEVRAGRFREDLFYRLHVIPIHMPPLRDRHKDVMQLANAFLVKACRDENKFFNQFDAEVSELFMNYPWPGNVRELANVVRNIVVLNDGEEVQLSMLPASFGKDPNGPLSLDNAHHATQIANQFANSEAKAEANEQQANITSQPAEVGYQINGHVDPLWLAEKKYIEKVISGCNGNVPKAAAILEVSPSTIYRKKQQWSEKLI